MGGRYLEKLREPSGVVGSTLGYMPTFEPPFLKVPVALFGLEFRAQA